LRRIRTLAVVTAVTYPCTPNVTRWTSFTNASIGFVGHLFTRAAVQTLYAGDAELACCAQLTVHSA
jgi:hypothetical protein